MEMVQLLLLLVPFLLLILLGLPIFLSMGAASAIFILVNFKTMSLLAIPENMIARIDSFGFLAIPFFFLAGDLMSTGGLTKKLVSFANSLVGHIRGGLSHVSVVANMIMAGISGSAAADAAATGGVLIPAMKKGGYSAPYAAAIVAAAATIGPIIPPSIPFVILGNLTNVSIGRLFLGGAIPGVIMGLYLIVASYLISKKRNYPASKRETVVEVIRSFLNSFFAIVMPLIIVLGIVFGVVTPTEAGVVAVFYALVVGLFIYKELKWKDIPGILLNSFKASSYVMIILAASGVFSFLIAYIRAGDIIINFFASITMNKWVILGILNLFFLIWGCVLDPSTGLIVVVPMLMPLIEKVGIDPVHFGVVIVLNLMIGLITPPVCFLTYLTTKISGATFESVVREQWPFFWALLLALVTTTFVPPLVTWLPNLLLGGGQ
jgi:tripartite ATP-independent transporter DctM subunit